mgnify:CR=1 FL=1
MQISSEERSLLMEAIEKNRDGENPVCCSKCNKPIEIKRDEIGRVISTSCKCGKFNATFRPI